MCFVYRGVATRVVSTLEQVEHSTEGTSLRLDDGERIDCRLLVDCSGHKSELVERSGVDNPGVQIAYGAEVEVLGKSRKDCCREGWISDVISAAGTSTRGFPRVAVGIHAERICGE